MKYAGSIIYIHFSPINCTLENKCESGRMLIMNVVIDEWKETGTVKVYECDGCGVWMSQNYKTFI